MKKIGILGGSFDPVHLGHISIAEAALEELALDEVLLMPANVNPFKVGRKMAQEEDRLAMLELAVREHPSLGMTRIEIDTDEVSYTFDTLARISKERPDSEIWFLTGADTFIQIESWYRGKDLLSLYHFGLAPRPGTDPAAYEEQLAHYRRTYQAEIFLLHNPLLDISSSAVRELAGKGASLEGLVPGSVERYIYEHGIYQ